MRRARSRGLTLVEVLLAAVVTGAGLAVVCEAITMSIRADIRADNMIRVARLLDLQVNRLEGGVLPIQAATGDFSDDGEADVTWNLAVDTTDTANLQQVTITATWIEHGEPHDLDVVRLMYTDPDAVSATASLGGSGGTSSQLGGSNSGTSSGSSSSTGSSGLGGGGASTNGSGGLGGGASGSSALGGGSGGSSSLGGGSGGSSSLGGGSTNSGGSP
jgi:type II secretory pathway pseudopilin PulG